MANEDLRFADSCYAARAERSVEDRADAENAKKMIAAYKRAQADPAVLQARPWPFGKQEPEESLHAQKGKAFRTNFRKGIVCVQRRINSDGCLRPLAHQYRHDPCNGSGNRAVPGDVRQHVHHLLP